MQLEEFLRELQYTKQMLPNIMHYEKEFLRDRAIALGVDICGLVKLEEMLRGDNMPPKINRRPRNVVKYRCPELKMTKTDPQWKKYFDDPKLSAYNCHRGGYRYKRKYSFIRIEEKK